MNPWWKIAAGAIALALAFAGGCRYEGTRKDAVIAQMKTDQANERVRQSLAQVKAVDDARAEEQRRAFTFSEIANEAKSDSTRARSDAAAMRAAIARVQQRPASPGSRGGNANDSTPTAGGPATENAPVVLAELLERAGDLAEYADATRIAGQACERSYDALTPTEK